MFHIFNFFCLQKSLFFLKQPSYGAQSKLNKTYTKMIQGYIPVHLILHLLTCFWCVQNLFYRQTKKTN